MLESFFKYFISFHLFVQCQYNYNLHFEKHFPGKISCPQYHTYVLGLNPHTCVSYLSDCLGVTEVEIKKNNGSQLLCHPNYQINFTSNAKLHKNFYVDPTFTISLSVQNDQFSYTQDIQIPNCFIAYVWYTTNTNVKSYHCLYYSGAYSLGNKPFADYKTTGNYQFLYTYGSYDEFQAVQCRNQDCNGCKFDQNLASYNCTSCFGDRFVNDSKRDCSLVCPIPGGLCDELNPIPKQCRPGFVKVMISATDFICNPCDDSDCLNCEGNVTSCSQCDSVLWDYQDFRISSLLNSYNQCYDLDNCIEYKNIPLNQTAYQQYCLQTNIGYVVYNPTNITSCATRANCYHCDSFQCLVCLTGYYLVLGRCQPIQKCDPLCQTCLTNDPQTCTSCSIGKQLKNGLCVCKEACLTCLPSLTECLSCRPDTFRYLNETKCLCLDGYYDGGDADYICYQCHHTCLTCNGVEKSKCLTCETTYNRHLQKGQCICDYGYGEKDVNQTDLVCNLCYYRCNTCIYANDKGSCTSCFSQQYRELTVVGTCFCMDNYGDDLGTKDVCYKCHYTCGYCNGLTSTSCLQCSYFKSHRYLVGKTCVCLKGYYENVKPSFACSSCYYWCADCLPNSGKDQCTECPITRVPDGDGTAFSCLCKYSNQFDDGINNECQLCHYTCLTCSYYGPSFCLTCDLSVRFYSSQTCLCFPGTYDDGTTNCPSCHPTCLTCDGRLSSRCLSCQEEAHIRHLKGGYCLCLDGYFEENGEQVCQKCSFRCKTCSVSKDSCLICADNSFREFGLSQCFCPKGYYEIDQVSVCQSCHFTCSKCTGTLQNQCTKCDPLANRYLSNNKCLCLTHYYESNIEQCTICSSSCNQCEISYDNCTSCLSDRILVGNTCKCGSKLLGSQISTYTINNSPRCSRCHYSCLTCIGSTNRNCKSCYEIENRYLTEQKCLCNQGYFDAGVPECKKCSQKCLTCAYSENSCLSCPQSTFRVLNSQIKTCLCSAGYFEDGGNLICQKCDYKCFQCQIRSDNCLICQQDSYRQFNSELFTCDCQPGYYDDGEVICKPCHYSCYECFGQSKQQCISCLNFIPTSKRLYYEGQCICQRSYYDDGYSSYCQPCDVSCLACENQSYICTACSTTRDYSNQTCECQTGYYDIGQKECSVCDKNCFKCKFKASICIDCDSSKFKVLNSETKSCVCISGFIEINNICQQCKSSCQTCLNNIDYCTSCVTNRYLSNGQCFCQGGYFEFQGGCQVCHKSCQTCQDNELYCLTCSTLNHRKLTINNTCDCFDGYFAQLITTSCEQCDPSCKTCTLNSQNCTSCEKSLNLDILDNKCVCSTGYYPDSITKICLKCHISCQSCDQYQKCTSCLENTRSLDSYQQTCDCQQGYFEANQANCEKCSYQCYTCENSMDNCLSCYPQVNRQLQKNKCQCQQGFVDAGIEICIPCAGTCKACLGKASFCTLCYEQEQKRILIGNNCICQPGYYETVSNICQKCSLKCKTCVGSAEHCTSCDTDQKRLDHSIIHKCPCMQGFYDDEQSVCQKCHIKCEGCLNSRVNCLSCKSSVKSNRYLLADQCNCRPGFYDDNIQLECQKCNYRCKTCVGNDVNCLLCVNNLRISPPQCSCQDGYYEDEKQNCMECLNQCQTCEIEPSNCLTCKIGRINKSCDCLSGYFEAGQQLCLKCGFQCLECSKSFNNCALCRGDRINIPSCICADGYYDDGINEDCLICDFRCLTCNFNGCLTCNGNRILQNESTCDPPKNSVSYDTTPWCSNCEVAVLIIRFSDDLTSILIKFDFGLKQTQQIQSCSEILSKDTLNKLGFGYSCNINEFDSTILKISLGQEPSIIVNDQIYLKPGTFSHINCQKNLMTFIFENVQAPLNYLEPQIQFKVPNYKINSCIENNIFSNHTLNDGKRRFAYINWRYKIIDQENDPNMDAFIVSLNAQQYEDLFIPALTLPSNSQITFIIQIKNFLGTQSSSSFNVYTQFDSQPIIQLDMKNSYYSYQNIYISFQIEILNCRAGNKTQSSLFQIDLVETDLSVKKAKSSNVNYSFQSSNTSYSVFIPKFTLTPQTTYYFNLSAFDVNSQMSSQMQFSIEIKQAEIICQFAKAATIQDCRQDLEIHIQCRDMNTDANWNEDPGLILTINCIDLFTSQNCMNQNNEKIQIEPNSYYQKVPKHSVKPFSTQSWEVIATKGNITKKISHTVVFLEENFFSLSMIYDVAYLSRPINNYELLNFTYDIALENRSNVVEMSAEIISDFVVISIEQPKYFEYQFKFQEKIGTKQIQNSNYNLRFSVQFSNNINPSYFNLPVTLNTPPICQKLKKSQSNSSSLTYLEITPICSKSEDQPYQYKFGYFLTESDLQEYLSGDKSLILGETNYQTSPKLTKLIPNSFLNSSIYFLVSIMDQGGSITNIQGKTEIQNIFNCTYVKNQNLTNLEPNQLLNQFVQVFGLEGQDCNQLKESTLQQLYNKINFQSQDLHVLLKALSISKKYQSISQQRRVLDELSYQSCYNQKNDTFCLNQILGESNQTTYTLKQIDIEIKNFQSAVQFLTSQYNEQKLLIQNQTSEWNQKINEQYEQIKAGLLQLYLLPDKIFLKISTFSTVDESLFSNCILLLNLIQKLSVAIQDSIQINGDPLSMTGEMITWQLTRQQKETLLGVPIDLQNQIVKFSQKEQTKVKLNPYKYSNKTIENIKNKFNFSKIIIDPQMMIQTQLKSVLYSGKLIVQNKTEGNYSINLEIIPICDNSSTQSQLDDYKVICVLLQQSDSINQCSTNIIQQGNQSFINCRCQEFGSIFLVYFQDLENNTNSSIPSDEEESEDNFQILGFDQINLNFLLGYIGLVDFITLLLILYESKKETTQVHPFDTQQKDQTKLEIKCYPGTYQIIKNNFKFIHQLPQFCYDSSSLIKKSYHFIDINIQFSFMLLIIYLMDFNINKYQQVAEIILVMTSGVIYRFLSKIFQGFARINQSLRIFIYILLEIFLIFLCLSLSAKANIQSTQLNYNKVINWLIGLVIYETLIEFMLIFFCVLTYKVAYKSINYKEYKLNYHLIYYFAYQEILEQVFQQFIIL